MTPPAAAAAAASRPAGVAGFFHEDDFDTVPDEAPGWPLPGALVVKLVAVAVLAVLLAGGGAAWLVAQAASQAALQRLVRQQNDEVETVARVLASKIEQSQRVLGTVAEGIAPGMLEYPASLEWVVRQGLPAVRLFDAVQVARKDGQLSVNLQSGRLQQPSALDPAERDSLVRTMVEGKPLVSDLIGSAAGDARVMFTMPLRQGEGQVTGAVAGVLRLQSQGLLPQSMAMPVREDSRLIVFTRDGVILSHPQRERVLGHVRDEPGLAQAYARWQRMEQPLTGRAFTDIDAGHVVSLAGMPLPQWMVARVSDAGMLAAPDEGAQRTAWWLAGGGVLAIALASGLAMLWLARPLAQLSHCAQRMLHAHVAHKDGERGAAAALRWPRSPGEVDALARVCSHMEAQRWQERREAAVTAARLEAVLAHAPVGIVLARGDVLELAGVQAARMLGYAPAELHGLPAQALHAGPSDYAQWLQRVGDAFAAHGGFDGDVRFLRKDGSPVWARVLAHRPAGPAALAEAAGTLWLLEDITAERGSRQLRGWVAGHDPLTRLLNRGAFVERLGELMLAQPPAAAGVAGAEAGAAAVPAASDGTAAAQDGAELGTLVVLFMDLDHFTMVNHQAGHDAGDDVLRHVARLIEEQVRHVGWAARLGGDEFAVVLPACSRARGHEIAELIRAAISAWEPSYGGRSFLVSASVGLVALEPGSAGEDQVNQLLRAADMACYEAKRRGRNQVWGHPARDG